MDVKKLKLFLVWKISRKPISSDLGGPSLWRIEGVLVTSILILREIFRFLYYANEGSGDIIGRSTKTIKY